MFVLNANDAIVVTPGVAKHELAGAAVDLRAQVTGATVASYAWTLDPNHPTDFKNVSALNTYQLTFTWDSFTGAAHTDTVTITRTNTDQTQETQTLTFVVNSTSSPAWSAAPTSFGTWPTVLTPDALTADRAAVDSQYYRLGLATGEVMTGHTLPHYNPGVPPLALTYSSTAADRMPIFIDHYPLDPTQSVPANVYARLTLKDSQNNVIFSGATVTYSTGSVLNPGDIGCSRACTMNYAAKAGESLVVDRGLPCLSVAPEALHGCGN